MAEESFAERTEQATGRRRAEARRKGQVARSREIPAVLVLLAGVSILFSAGAQMGRQLSAQMVKSLTQITAFSLNPENVFFLCREGLASMARMLGPLLLGVLAAAVLGNFVQVGTLLSPEAIRPDLSKLNPFKGLGRLFSKQGAVELLKSLGKLLIIGWVAFSTMQEEWPQLMALWHREVGGILACTAQVSLRICLKSLLAMALLAALDYFFQRWSFEKGLRMTKREVQEEFKQTEGDPLIKSRIRSLQREMARRRMMAEVPKADVIITNPAHLAVALQYQPLEMSAPVVVAKGAGWIAEKIKEVARAHRVPILENKPLAQALFRGVDLGQMIPSAFYQAVADILAYVYRMRKSTL